MPLNQYGQTPIDPRAALLLGRAQRPEPIDTGMSLIGRLAALGVGQSQQRGFEQQIAESRLGYSQALQQAGNDPTARLSVLSQAAASPDPSMRADALQQIAAMTQPQEQPETFRPLTAEEAQAVGLPAGASAQISSRGKISTLFTPSEPEGPTTSVREFTDVFGRPPASPEEFARFQAMKRPPGATVNVNTGAGFKVPPGFMLNETGDGVVPIPGAGTETPAETRAATAEMKAAEVEAIKAKAADAASQYRSAVSEWRNAPTNAAAIAKMEAARKRMVQMLAKNRSAPLSVTDADIEAANAMIPSPAGLSQGAGMLQGVDPFDAAMAVAEREMGIESTQAAPPAGARPDGTAKGSGWLGVLQRPDGRVSTEISVGVNIDGKETLIPTMVPTLTKQEVDWLLTNDVSDPRSIPQPIIDKAVAHAKKQIAAGKSPFKDGTTKAPASVPQDLWDLMTEEERAAWP